MSIQAITNQYNSEKIPEIIKDYRNMQTCVCNKNQNCSDDKDSILKKDFDKNISNNNHLNLRKN